MALPECAPKFHEIPHSRFAFGYPTQFQHQQGIIGEIPNFRWFLLPHADPSRLLEALTNVQRSTIRATGRLSAAKMGLVGLNDIICNIIGIMTYIYTLTYLYCICFKILMLQTWDCPANHVKNHWSLYVLYINEDLDMIVKCIYTVFVYNMCAICSYICYISRNSCSFYVNQIQMLHVA